MKTPLTDWMQDARNIFGFNPWDWKEDTSTETDLKEEIRLMEEFHNRCFD